MGLLPYHPPETYSSEDRRKNRRLHPGGAIFITRQGSSGERLLENRLPDDIANNVWVVQRSVAVSAQAALVATSWKGTPLDLLWVRSVLIISIGNHSNWGSWIPEPLLVLNSKCPLKVPNLPGAGHSFPDWTFENWPYMIHTDLLLYFPVAYSPEDPCKAIQKAPSWFQSFLYDPLFKGLLDGERGKQSVCTRLIIIVVIIEAMMTDRKSWKWDWGSYFWTKQMYTTPH